MEAPQSRIYFTEEEYLSFERSSEERHEYVDGRIFAMAGESDQHGEISSNIFGTFSPNWRANLAVFAPRTPKSVAVLSRILKH